MVINFGTGDAPTGPEGNFPESDDSVTEISLCDSRPLRRQHSFHTTCSRVSGSLSTSRSASSFRDDGGSRCEVGSLSAATTRKLFPYHVVIDQDFSILQVGNKLASILGVTEKFLYHFDVDEVFQFERPQHAKWTRSWKRKLEDQEFVLRCISDSSPKDMLFKGTLVATNPGEAMLVLCPEANNLTELRDMNLTISDLPAHGAYREAVFLREHLSKQLNNALKMEKLSKRLQTEKELLESLIPKHAAEGLRKGEAVQPRIHHNVTMVRYLGVHSSYCCSHGYLTVFVVCLLSSSRTL